MTIELAFACAIAFAVALVQASRRTITSSGHLLGPVQIGAGMLGAALMPTLTVYSLHFHTAWTLGIDPDTELAQSLTLHGFELALGTAVALFLVAGAAYFVSARLLISGRRAAGLLPVVVAGALVLVVLVRGAVGGRFTGDDPPPTIVATVIVLIFLVAAIVATGRLDARLNE